MSAKDDQIKKAAGGFLTELGVEGVNMQSGYVFEEFLPELQGERGRKVYRQMADNEAIIGGFLRAADSMLKRVEWNVQPSDKDKSGEYAEFVEQCLTDMEQPWSEFVSEALSMLIYGWALCEKVYKRRIGPYEKNPIRKSKFADGRIGIRKLAFRAQETLARWDMNDRNEPIGMIQQPPDATALITIPFEKSLHFRTTTSKGNPEGKSMLRTAYRSWYFKNNIEMVESIGIERDLAGLPVVYIPNEILTNPDHAAILNKYFQIARDLKLNSQGGLVLPSDLWKNDDGKLTNQKLVSVELMSSAGTRTIDTNAVIARYNKDILVSVLAQFLLLGGEGKGGSYSLSKNATDLFLASFQCVNDTIADVCNTNLLPELWQLNGFDHEYMPTLEPGEIKPQDLEEIGSYITSISGAGVTVGGDLDTDNMLRGMIGLPPLSEDQLLALQPADPFADPTKQDKPVKETNEKARDNSTDKRTGGSSGD